MKDSLRKVWSWVKWPIFVLVGLYVVAVIWRAFVLYQADETAADVAAIHASVLKWSDINGELPSAPNPVENDKTLLGVDTNFNNIRDDVERYIYLENKNNPAIAIGMLQYAKNLELYLTKVHNEETWKAVAEDGDRAYRCIFETFEKQNNENTFLSLQLTNTKTKKISSLVFDSQERIRAKEHAYSFTTSYGNPGIASCDLSLEDGNN